MSNEDVVKKRSPCILVLSLSHSDESLSRRLVSPLRECVEQAGASAEIFDARALPPIWVHGAKLDGAPAPYLHLERLMADADGIVLTHPIYAYSASSSAKTILELYCASLDGKAVGFASAAGTLRSYLAVVPGMVAAMFDANAFCYPRTLQVTAADHAGHAFNADVRARITAFAAGFTEYTRAIATLRVAPRRRAAASHDSLVRDEALVD